jgi:sugar lactone lactonase YvrE
MNTGRLFFLDGGGGRIISANPDGSDRAVISAPAMRTPDGIVIDAAAGHIYWTNMGVPHQPDGSIDRCDLDGGNRVSIVPQGATFTPKQLHLDHAQRKLYWSDREGMRVMRANLDGSHLEVLVVTGSGEDDRRDARNWCVGIAVDAAHGHLYWTQKGGDNSGTGRIFRAGLQLPQGADPARRSDLEVVFSDLPEPIDLEIDAINGYLYWSDRGDPPRGNTISRAKLRGHDRPGEQEILYAHLMEGIGLALDVPGDRMFMCDLGGSVYAAKLNGAGGKPILFGQGNLTGIAYAVLPR